MTACVNKRRALAAALAGVLALGGACLAAPSLAFAEGASAQWGKGTTATETGTEISKGSIVLEFLADNGTPAGQVLSQGTEASTGIVTVAATGSPIQVAPMSVKAAGLDSAESAENVSPTGNYKVRVYATDEDGNKTGAPLASRSVTDPGTYIVEVTALAESKYYGQTFSQTFKVVGADLPSDLVAVENYDAADTYFMFSGDAKKVTFYSATERRFLTEGVDFTVTYTGVSATTNGASTGKSGLTSIVNAGTYTATLTGIGKYAGKSVTLADKIVVAPFMVDQYTTVADTVFSGTMPSHPAAITRDATSVGGVYNGSLDPEYATIDNGSTTVSANGKYSFTVTFDADQVAAGNIVGRWSVANGTLTPAVDDTHPVTVIKVGDASGAFWYDGAALSGSYDLYLDKADELDLDDVKAYFAGKVQKDSSLVDNDVSWVRSDGSSDSVIGDNEVAGTEVKVTFSYAKSDYSIGGQATVTIHVWEGSIDVENDLYAYADSENGNGAIDTTNEKVAIDSYTSEYTAEAITANFFHVANAAATASTHNVVGGLNATLYKADGTKVSQAVDAGEYYLLVTSSKWKLSGEAKLPVTITKYDISSVASSLAEKWNAVDGEEAIVLDSEVPNTMHVSWNEFAISKLGLKCSHKNYVPDSVDVSVEKKQSDGTWKAVGTVAVKDEYEVGEYRAVLTVADSLAANFEGSSVTIDFTVAEGRTFSDVQPSAWYYGYVNGASHLGYMNGIAGTTTFAPEGKLTRAQAAVVLYNMSGVSLNADETQNGYDTTTGYKTGFADIDGNSAYNWAAKAIYWAKEVGVVTGYLDGSGNYGPDDYVTREQFATMLARYAKAVNGATDTEASDELEFTDAASVDGWAKGSVAWCVSRKVVNGGEIAFRPTDTVSRAEVAKMVVKYQNPNKNGITYDMSWEYPTTN